MEKKTIFTLLMVAFVLGAAATVAVTESFDHIDMMGNELKNASTVQADQFNFTTGCIYENASGIVIDGDGSGC